jgi:hypothetical protein
MDNELIKKVVSIMVSAENLILSQIGENEIVDSMQEIIIELENKLPGTMTVEELSKDQFEQLKFNYLYDTENNYSCTGEIPDSEVIEHYKDISFVDDDFAN